MLLWPLGSGGAPQDMKLFDIVADGNFLPAIVVAPLMEGYSDWEYISILHLDGWYSSHLKATSRLRKIYSFCGANNKLR